MLHSPVDLLRAGKCTGALTFLGADGIRKLQVRKGPRERGLLTVDALVKGEHITTVMGTLIDNCSNISPCQEVFKWSKKTMFVMNHDALVAGSGLGILVNTAGMTGKNNAKYSCNRIDNVLNICATCKIAPGEEILAAYGRSYSSKINVAVKNQNEKRLQHKYLIDKDAPVVLCKGAVARMLCAKCRKKLTSGNRLTHARFCMGNLGSF